VAVFILFLLQFGYYAGFEAWWNGQTPGKRRQHLRVIKDTGRPITVYESVARNLLRVVDSIPGFYGVGIVSMLLSAQNKRLGDYVAGTVVVHEKPFADQAKVSWNFASSGAASALDLSRLSPEEFQLMETFLLRREQLARDVRASMARQIALRVGEKLKIPAEDRQNPEALIEKLANEYRNCARFL
ncbi:MAG: RDD family protein, partial [Acidobacteriia bacterium]|nr:RDD family protein [Terriglobia bacterium]